MKRISFILLSLFTIAALLVSACEQTEEIITPKEEEEQALTSIMTEAGKVVPLTANKDEIVGIETDDKGDIGYTYEKHDVVDNIDSIVYLGLNDDIIWPGSLVKGTKAHDFIYEPISIDRGPVTLSISLESSTDVGSSINETVDDPKLSTIRQGISNLLKKAITSNTHVPAKVDFQYQQIYNESQMNLFVGVNVSYGAGNLNSKFNWDSTSKTNKIMAKYKQIYYSIDIDTPTSPIDLFDPSITTTEIASAISTGSKPLYVANVSYGMMALMFIETDYTEEQMKIALDAAYKGTVDVKLDFGFSAKEVLESSSIKIVVYGGSTAGLQDLETGYGGFKKVISASNNFGSDSPGVPLVYKFRHLSDNTLALVTLTSQYTLVKQLKLRQRVRVTVDQFVCTMADDEGVDTVDMDRFSVSASAYNRILEIEQGSPITENQYVYYWSTPGEHDMDRGDIFTAVGQNSIDLTFDTEFYNFDLARLVLNGYARDYDGIWSADEEGYGSMEIPGLQFFENGGQHKFRINSEDFEFEVYITIQALN